MRNILYALLALVAACEPSQRSEEKQAEVPPATGENTEQNPVAVPVMPVAKEDPLPAKSGRSQYYTTLDSVKIEVDGDAWYYSRQEYNGIVDDHPGFFESIVEYPDDLYYAGMHSGEPSFSPEFGSEAGRDEYYVLYSHFVKKQQGDARYRECRKKLISIYNDINSLFGQFQYGGTYFGHQQYRIPAYAEYSVYLYRSGENYREKTYDITKQKQLYIQSLRQLINDESTIDQNVYGEEKTERTKEMKKTVDRLERSITDVFYLRRAQEFHYRHYEYH